MTDSDQYLGVVGFFFNKTKNMVGLPTALV